MNADGREWVHQKSGWLWFGQPTGDEIVNPLPSESVTHANICCDLRKHLILAVGARWNAREKQLPESRIV
jgi:hypothetical protein